MKKKFQSIIQFSYKYSVVLGILVFWQIMVMTKIVPEFLLPSPLSVIKAFIGDFSLIMHHTKFTLLEAWIGMSIAIFFAFILSFLMDRFRVLYEILYPPIVISQTIPTVAIAPLLIIWLGFHMTPKIVLIVMTGFFPILISLLDGYRSVDADSIKLLKSMGATNWQTYRHVKLPASIGYFFAGLRVSTSYSIISAVVAEWLGGYYGLGVYMTRVRKAYALDKMFAIIFFTSFLSLILMGTINLIHKKVVKY